MLISCTVAAQLICTCIFVYANSRFSLDMVQMIYDIRNLLFAYLKNRGEGTDSFYFFCCLDSEISSFLILQ